jgi:histidyl-tRNA synthetase
MKLSTQPYKGARDFYPEDKRIQKYMFGVMRKVVEKFGYEEYDAPILEPTDLFLVKGNQEIIDEQTYTFKDRGDRSVTVRTEMTPTVSRMVAGRRQELAYPLRWYSIPNLWRYERTQRGRLREFWQLNVDIFGVGGLEAEHEIILVADQIMKAYGATAGMYSINLNSRKFMDHIMSEYLGLDEVQAQTLAKLIDRIHKMDRDDFAAQADAILSPSQREQGANQKLLDLMHVKKLSELPEELKSHPSCLDLAKLLHLLEEDDVFNAQFDVTIMRGFDYYTDIVFEVFDKDPENNRSMFGGGRYDGMVGQFGVEQVPTVGFGMGDVTLLNFLESHDLLPELKPETEAYVVLVGDVYEHATKLFSKLRSMGLRIAVDISGRKLDKQIRTADKRGIRYVIFVGEQELEEDRYKIRNLKTGEEEVHSPERIVSIIEDHRAQ